MMIRKGLKTVTQISHLTLLSRRAAGGWGYIFAPPPPFFLSLNPSPNPTTFSKLRDQTQKQEKEKWLAVQVELFLLWCLLYCQFANSKATCSLAGRRKGLRKRYGSIISRSIFNCNRPLFLLYIYSPPYPPPPHIYIYSGVFVSPQIKMWCFANAGNLF